jgi:ABC-type lipoprotein release transport system permease subunit
VDIGDVRSVLFYSRRDIFKNKKIFIFITLALIFATANIITINGLMDGFIKDLVDNTVESSLGDLNVYPDENNRFIDGLEIKEQKLASLLDIKAYSPRVTVNGVLSNKELSRSVAILALDPDKEEAVTKLLEKLDKGVAISPNDNNAILVGYRLAEDLKLDLGDEVSLAFENRNTREYKVKGIVRTGVADFDSSTIIMTLNEANRQLHIDNRASVILVKISDRNLADQYKPVLMQDLDVNNVKTWKEETEYILSFTKTYKDLIGVISAIVLIAAAISIGVVIYINVAHKTRQIGIMKAIGAKDSFIFTVFIIEAALFGLIGVSIGDAVGYLGIKYFEANPFYDVIAQAQIRAAYSNYLLYSTTIVSFTVTMLAGIYPAIKASRVDIIRAIWRR